MPLRPTPLLGFKPPFVKNGDIVLPVVTGTGDTNELAGSPAVWSSLLKTLEPVVRRERTAATARDPLAPVGKPSGRIL